MNQQLQDKLTNGGRVPLPVGVSAAKMVAADKIVEGIRRGDAMAIAEFKRHLGARFSETLTTGDDFIFAFTQLTALAVDTEFESATRTWDQALGIERVSTFDAPKRYSIDYTQVEGFARPQTEPGKPDWVPPIVPEGSPYPLFNFGAEAAQAGAIHKAGGRFNLTFERIVSDAGTIVPQLPRIITEFLLDREEYDAWTGLLAFIDNPANHLQATTTLDGFAVDADAPISREAISAALYQARNATINGRKVSVSGYNIVVPTGEADVARFYLNNFAVDGMQTGSDPQYQVSFPGYNPVAGVRGVVESDYFTGSQWALIPAPGAVRGNKPFASLGRLIGHEGPEVRVQNVTGNYVGGGSVAPFEGSFDTDSAALRGRIIGGFLGWNSEYAVISDGTGSGS